MIFYHFQLILDIKIKKKKKKQENASQRVKFSVLICVLSLNRHH